MLSAALGALPLLHFGGSYPEGFLHSDWRIEPSILVVAFGLIAGYLYLTGPFYRARHGADAQGATSGQRAAFLWGVALFIVALGPPLDDWSGAYLLSAHMFQHLVLMLVVAPLWLIGLPAWFFDPIVRRPMLSAAVRAVTRPVPALAIGSAIMVVWHLPVLYDEALAFEPLHILQHDSFLVAGMLLWWPILSPVPAWPRTAPLLQCLLLFLETLPGGVVGAFITLAEPGVYKPYIQAPRLWGLSLESDQQIAGLMMWVGVPTIYLIIISVIFFRWVGREERAEHAALRPPGRPDPALHT